MHVHERLLRSRHVEQRVAGGGHLAEARADDEQHVRLAHARGERRVDADADVARVARASRCRARPGVGTRHPPAASCPRGTRAGRRTRCRRPAGAADDRERPLGRLEQRGERVDVRGRRARLDDVERAARRRRRSTPRACPPAARARPGPGRPAQAVVYARAMNSGMRSTRSICATHLRKRAEHPAVVDLLERLALLLRRRDLPDEQDQRRRVLERGVHADRRLGRAGPARDHADAGTAGQLAVRLRHVGRARLVAARDQPDRRLVEAVEQLEVALARHAERDLGAVHRELVGEQLAAPARRSQTVLEVDARALELRLLVVGRVDVADRALALPLAPAARARARTPSPRSPTRRRTPGRGRSRTTTRTARTRATSPASRSGSVR